MQIAAGDKPFVGPFDQALLREFFGNGGLRLAFVPGGPFDDIDRCSIDDPDHIGDKCKTTPCICAIGKLFGAEHLQRRVASPPEGETGQRPPIMSALLRLHMILLLERSAAIGPRSVARSRTLLLDLPHEIT